MSNSLQSMSVSQRLLFYMAMIFIYKILNNLVPAYLHVYNSDIYHYHTKDINNIHIRTTD